MPLPFTLRQLAVHLGHEGLPTGAFAIPQRPHPLGDFIAHGQANVVGLRLVVIGQAKVMRALPLPLSVRPVAPFAQPLLNQLANDFGDGSMFLSGRRLHFGQQGRGKAEGVDSTRVVHAAFLLTWVGRRLERTSMSPVSRSGPINDIAGLDGEGLVQASVRDFEGRNARVAAVWSPELAGHVRKGSLP